ncbi:hypothetical protein MSG28_003655 [Choristoneura fumiferana]|uniref:Uncharacterized protein n=1 Tax=Choristoneura fumiferana TaxID=7141 RepID=A0ACC0KGH1_CHOFU|nr:hypothetical protein MSG28_003655 [Choristoneura fumiferana]
MVQISTKELTMSLEEQFKQVSDSVRNWKTKPADSENLALYSLYKQAIAGDQFDQAAANVKKLKALPSDSDLLELYALFKQATKIIEDRCL